MVTFPGADRFLSLSGGYHIHQSQLGKWLQRGNNVEFPSRRISCRPTGDQGVEREHGGLAPAVPGRAVSCLEKPSEQRVSVRISLASDWPDSPTEAASHSGSCIFCGNCELDPALPFSLLSKLGNCLDRAYLCAFRGVGGLCHLPLLPPPSYVQAGRQTLLKVLSNVIPKCAKSF